MSKNTTQTGPVVKPVTVRLPYSTARIAEDIATFHYTDLGNWISEQIIKLIENTDYDILAIRETLAERERHDKNWRFNPQRQR